MFLCMTVVLRGFFKPNVSPSCFSLFLALYLLIGTGALLFNPLEVFPVSRLNRRSASSCSLLFTKILRAFSAGLLPSSLSFLDKS